MNSRPMLTYSYYIYIYIYVLLQDYVWIMDYVLDTLVAVEQFYIQYTYVNSFFSLDPFN